MTTTFKEFQAIVMESFVSNSSLNESSDFEYKKSDGKQPSYVVTVFKGDLKFTSHLEDGDNFVIPKSKNVEGLPFEEPLDLKLIAKLANEHLKSNDKYSAIRSTKGTSSMKDVYLVDTTKKDNIFYI